MTFEKRFRKALKRLLQDYKINDYNRKLFKKFFIWQENKLKRLNDLPQLDESSYKTLYDYINRFRNVNNWFNNKPWNELTKSDIEKVYNDLEDGVITNYYGKRFEDRRSYYNKVFKYKPFQLAGLKDIVENALEFYTDKKKKEVRFITNEDFKKMVGFIRKPHHFVLFWLAWDIGENISSLLQLKVKHFKRQINAETNEAEYLVYLPQKMLKRSRRSRTEPTIYTETVHYLDSLFKFGKEIEYRDTKGCFRRKVRPFKSDDYLFSFGYRQALQIFNSVVRRSGVKCQPNGEKPGWKDLRSGMACQLFAQGWHVEDINLRLGHSPQSKWLNSYINYLAVKRKKTVKKHFDISLETLKKELQDSKQRETAIRLKLVNQDKKLTGLTEAYNSLIKGKDFMMLLNILNNKKKQISKVLKNLSDTEIDII